MFKFRSTGAPQSYDVLNDQGEVVGWVLRDRYGDGKWQAGNGTAQASAGTRKAAVEAWQEAVKAAEELHALSAELHELSEKVHATQYAGSGMTTAWHALVSAETNADEMAAEGSFAPYSAGWYRSVLSAFEIQLAQYDPSHGDPYTRNIEHDRVNKDGAFAEQRFEIGPRQEAVTSKGARELVHRHNRWINGKRFTFVRYYDLVAKTTRITVKESGEIRHEFATVKVANLRAPYVGQSVILGSGDDEQVAEYLGGTAFELECGRVLMVDMSKPGAWREIPAQNAQAEFNRFARMASAANGSKPAGAWNLLMEARSVARALGLVGDEVPAFAVRAYQAVYHDLAHAPQRGRVIPAGTPVVSGRKYVAIGYVARTCPADAAAVAVRFADGEGFRDVSSLRLLP
jgi:hypothetical protein